MTFAVIHGDPGAKEAPTMNLLMQDFAKVTNNCLTIESSTLDMKREAMEQLGKALEEAGKEDALAAMAQGTATIVGGSTTLLATGGLLAASTYDSMKANKFGEVSTNIESYQHDKAIEAARVAAGGAPVAAQAPGQFTQQLKLQNWTQGECDGALASFRNEPRFHDDTVKGVGGKTITFGDIKAELVAESRMDPAVDKKVTDMATYAKAQEERYNKAAERSRSLGQTAQQFAQNTASGIGELETASHKQAIGEENKINKTFDLVEAFASQSQNAAAQMASASMEKIPNTAQTFSKINENNYRA